MENGTSISKIQWIFIIGSIISIILAINNANYSPKSRLPEFYSTAQECVDAHLFNPETSSYPEYKEGMVKYNSLVLEDLGDGYLQYRIYDVKSYVYATNQTGEPGRANFFVQVYVYVDDYSSSQYGEQGTHKGVEDHYYSFLRDLE